MAWSFDWPPTRTCQVLGPPGAGVSCLIVPVRWAARPGWPLAAVAPAAGIAAIAPSHATSATRIVVNRGIIGPLPLSQLARACQAVVPGAGMGCRGDAV